MLKTKTMIMCSNIDIINFLVLKGLGSWNQVCNIMVKDNIYPSGRGSLRTFYAMEKGAYNDTVDIILNEMDRQGIEELRMYVE